MRRYPLCSLCDRRHPREVACDPPDIYADETGTSEYRIWLGED